MLELDSQQAQYSVQATSNTFRNLSVMRLTNTALSTQYARAVSVKKASQAALRRPAKHSCHSSCRSQLLVPALHALLLVLIQELRGALCRSCLDNP